MNIEKIVKDYLKELESQEQDYIQKIKEIKTKKCGLNEFLEDYKQKQKELLIQAKEISISNGNKIVMDDKDILKMNLFLEYIDKVGEVQPMKIIKQKMPKLEYYIYNKKKRLWNSWREFCDDYTAWINREGYWTNAIPKPDNRPDNPNFPLMKNGNNKEGDV